MTAEPLRARIEYAPGEAWCVASGRVVLVCERDLAPERAAALHREAAAVETAAALAALVEAEPAALLGLVDVAGGRTLLRRHGVPASADDAALPGRFGEAWGRDDAALGAVVAAGGLAALDGPTLPLEGGVARVAAVRVAPRPADASGPVPAKPGPDAEAAPQPEAALGAFGQTQPPRATPLDDSAGGIPVPEEPAAAPAPPLRPAPTAAPVPAAAPAPHGDPLADTGNPIGGLIDSVPGFIKPAVDVRAVDGDTVGHHEPDGDAGVPPAAASPAAASPAVPAPSAPVPAPAPAAAPAPPAASAPDLGDHDGMTVTAERARELLAERERPQPAPATGPLVLSTLCPAGHVNAPGGGSCAQCGAPVDERTAAQRNRPEIAVAVLPSGERVPLGRGVVIGRRPRSRRVEDGRVPRLVTVESPGEDISRSHLELRVEDWNLVAVDLSSTNGTLLLREGTAPQRLRPEASTILQLGDRLDLGDGVVLTIEAAP
ncbi:FHA domain-containing protein [Agrococcus carbonis]|uniref:FHA domain-containing protein n=1 Tax=Agrococcus carbonis TaxID=684552 RepID=A0A1H1QJE3_9MICO|nr:FHA domain-containing protein [Agrococcus carbonis]SDS23544.1 FHA domain-containing protein [Agrococcus carbonis]